MTSVDSSKPVGISEPRQESVWMQGLREDYQALFVTPWSAYFGAALLVLISLALMASGLFWGVFGGLKLWGDYLNQWIGLGPLLGIAESLDNPLHNRISLMNISLVLGAFSAALLAGQFRVNRPPLQEYLWGAVGGTFMGIGAALAGGCTVGGFFTPLLFSSMAGWAMWFGLLSGAVIGLKLLLWTMEHVTWGTAAPHGTDIGSLRRFYPWLGAAVALGMLWWSVSWFQSPEKKLAARAILIVAGFALGFVLHRSRFCFSRVFREPFMTAEGEMTKAMIMALLIGIPAASVLLQRQTVDPYLAIPATFWIGSVVGGLVFGIGMIFAGGCASGSLWRIGEGHLKLVVAVFFFGWIGSIASGVLKRTGLTTVDLDVDFLDGVPEITSLGYQAFLPDLLQAWSWAYLVSFVILVGWYLWLRYNESTERFTLI